MTQEDKNLVKQYVCMSIPFSLKVQIKLDNEIFIGTIYGVDENSVIYVCEGNDYKEDTEFENIKPYLRPMSSMTEEEYNELKAIAEYYGFAPFKYIYDWCPNYEATDWLNQHHFDYRGLIEKGLAIMVDENNNPYKE